MACVVVFMSGLILFFHAVIGTGSAGVDYEIKDGEVALYWNQELKDIIGRMIGYPPLANKKKSSPLFSETEIDEILSHELDDEELKAINQNDPCAHDLVRTVFSIGEKWAIQMIDADGKLPAGILNGNLAWPGSHKECISVQVPPDPIDNQTGFGGRYCTTTWSIMAETFPVSLALCVPDTCHDVDFANRTKLQLFHRSHSILPKLNFLTNSSTDLISLTGVTCQEELPNYDAGAIVVWTIIYICLFLVIAGTSLTALEFYFPPRLRSPQEPTDGISAFATEINAEDATKDCTHENAELGADESDVVPLVPKVKGYGLIERIGDFLKCFCLIKNGTKILDTSDKGGNELRCIHGIRFLSMAWVILGHTYGFSEAINIVGNVLELSRVFNTFAFQMILQGSYSVDSFFVLSGFLLTYLFLREMNAREGKISWPAFYLHRYWRLTPVYAIVMAFDTKLALSFISGPFRPQIYGTSCEKSWWWNLLYINNFTPPEDSCMGWAWYLANDMQFYVISPLFLYALWRWPKIGLGIIASLFCGSWISNFVISYHYNLMAGYNMMFDIANIAVNAQRLQIYMDKIYIKPYTRIGSYLVGVLLGYAYSQTKGRTKFLSKTYQAIGWTASTILGFYIVFGLYHATPNRIEGAFYNTFNRCCFSDSLAWVIFACLTGHGEPVNKILSHSVFIPLGRLTYCAYLVHPIVMMIYFLSLPGSLIVTHFQMVMTYLGLLVVSYSVAFATTLLLESPTMAVEKLFRFDSTAKRKEENVRT